MHASLQYSLALLLSPRLGLALPMPNSSGNALDPVWAVVDPLTFAPSMLETTAPSPKCADLNGGAYLCCNSAIDGDQPVVVSLADAVGFPLDHNSVNGIGCKSSHQRVDLCE
jgi:hypothetical protein